jgi:electron-transferring-flavoprotein dehydrogenase
MKTGMMAAEAAFEALGTDRQHDELTAYPEAFRNSWLYDELHKARNFKPFMGQGLYTGTPTTNACGRPRISRRSPIRSRTAS